MYGHIAARLRKEMDTRGWKVADVNQAIGRALTNSAVYVWLAAKGAPGAATRAKLSKALKIPVADLTPRDEASGAVMVRAEKVVRRPREDEGYIKPPAPRDVLSFTIDNEGNARIRCDVTLPAVKGAAMLQILLNAGMVIEADDVA
jgi:transcriptional regulator with XRE-family HTH domain